MKLNTLAILAVILYSSVTVAGPGHDKEHSHQDKPVSTDKASKSMDSSAMEHHGGHQHDASGGAVGMPAMASQATKTIHLSTEDTMRFKFASTLNLQKGDIVKFVITNNGKIAHEFSIGDEKEQHAHREMMKKMPNMVHEDGNTVTIPAGETKELTWNFKQGSEVVFACNIPGHFEAGMFTKTTIATMHGHH